MPARAFLGAVTLSLLGACASTPAPAAPPPAVSGRTVRLVLRSVRAPEAHRDLAGDLDAQLCAEASALPGYEVVCAADVQAAAEVGQLRAALGQCDQTDECVEQVQALARGEQALAAEILASASGLSLSLVRAGADGEILRKASRTASTPGELQAHVASALGEVLR